MTWVPASSHGSTFNGGTITEPLVIAPSAEFADALTLRASPNGALNNTNLLVLESDAGGFIGAISARAGLELDLQNNSGGLAVFTPAFATALQLQQGTALIGTSAAQVGFYGQTPTALQTGVAVTAAAIHAALVNLGLITA